MADALTDALRDAHVEINNHRASVVLARSRATEAQLGDTQAATNKTLLELEALLSYLKERNQQETPGSLVKATRAGPTVSDLQMESTCENIDAVDNDEEEDELQDSAGRLHAQKVSEIHRVGTVGLLRNLPVTSATGSAAATAVAA